MVKNMKSLLIGILIKVGSNLLINLLRAGADELEKRKDNDFNSANVIKDTLSGVKINGRAGQ